jgi:hypothetical protein
MFVPGNPDFQDVLSVYSDTTSRLKVAVAVLTDAGRQKKDMD